MFLCICKAVPMSEAVDAARSGIESPESISEYFGFEDDECCGRCAEDIEQVAVLVQVELRKTERTGGLRAGMAAA